MIACATTKIQGTKKICELVLALKSFLTSIYSSKLITKAKTLKYLLAATMLQVADQACFASKFFFI